MDGKITADATAGVVADLLSDRRVMMPVGSTIARFDIEYSDIEVTNDTAVRFALTNCTTDEKQYFVAEVREDFS